MKKFLLLLLSLMLVFAFVACDLGGDDGDDDDADATPTPAPTATPVPTATPAGATPTPEPTPAGFVVDLTAVEDTTMNGSATYNTTESRLEITFGNAWDAWGRNYYDAARDFSAYSSLVIDAEIVSAGTNFKVYMCNGGYNSDTDNVLNNYGWDSVGRDTLTIDLTGLTINDIYQIGFQNNTANMEMYVYSMTFVE